MTHIRDDLASPAHRPAGQPAAVPYHLGPQTTLYHGDALDVVRTMPDGAADCVVTSPPYYWMRDYGTEGQYGLERTPHEYLDALLTLTAELRRVLAVDGTCWINVGDAYSQRKAIRASSHQEGLHGARGARPSWRESRTAGRARMSSENVIDGRAIPEKCMMMLPERLILGMQDQGWLLRSKIIWAKSWCTPDAAPDRPSGRWEPLYLLTRSPKYHWTRNAPGADTDVWNLPASRGAGTHTASYPIELPTRAIAAGCRPGGVVLDPFSGSGTTGAAALSLGRQYIGIDLNPAYHDLALARLRRVSAQ